MTSTPSGALEAVERILNRGGEREDVLRQVADALCRVYPYVRLGEVEIGEPAEPAFAVRNLRVGGGPIDVAVLERIAVLVGAYV